MSKDKAKAGSQAVARVGDDHVRSLAKAKAQPPKSKEPGWELDGMTPEQAEEACAIKARVLNRPYRAGIHMAGEEGARVLTVGSGTDASATLHSMRTFEALGSRSNSFVSDALHRISNALRLTGNDDLDSNRISAAVALVSAVAPQDELEATMAIQMVAANEAALMCFERSRKSEYIEHASAYSNMANKAMRSFALHAEAIAKLRRGGEQVVKHVHVNEGGQAVIAGTVNTGGRGA